MSGMRISGSYGGYGAITMPNGRVYDENSAQVKAMKRSGQVECETCASRKYQDGSDESNVSFKSPGHISPSASMATVSAHEREHVSNAYKSAAKDNGRVLQASVAYSRSICPECGRRMKKAATEQEESTLPCPKCGAVCCGHPSSY